MYALCAKTAPALSVWRKRIGPTCVALEASTLRHCSEICLQTGEESITEMLAVLGKAERVTFFGNQPLHIQCGAAIERLMTLFFRTLPDRSNENGIMSVMKLDELVNNFYLLSFNAG